jgi:transposase
MSDLFWLSEAQMARLTPLLPTDTPGKPWADDRRVISGIVHVLRSGRPRWHAPHAITVHRRRCTTATSAG